MDRQVPAFVSPVSLNLQISLAFLPGPVPGSCVGVAVVGLLCCCFLSLVFVFGEICHNLN